MPKTHSEVTTNQVLHKLRNLYSWKNIFMKEDEKTLKAGRILVEEQRKQHELIPSIKAIKNGDINKLKEILKYSDLLNAQGTPEEKIVRAQITKKLKERDPVGGAIIHIAYLHEKYDIGHFLVELDPESATLCYSTPTLLKEVFDEHPGPYTGENILHMVICQRNYKETAWLLKFFINYDCDRNDKLLPALLSAKTIGSFFQPWKHKSDDTLHFRESPKIPGNATLYFGEYPFLFAVCTNNIQLVRLLLLGDSNGLFQCDSYGNNCLHLCVLHQHIAMYSYLLNLARVIVRMNHHVPVADLKKPETSEESKDIDSFLNDSLIDVQNNDGHTPFTLAASLGYREVFEALLKNRQKTLWSFGPFHYISFNLRGFDNKSRIPRPTETSTKSKTTNNSKRSNTGKGGRNKDKDREGEGEGEEEKRMRISHQPDGAIDCICLNSRLELLAIPEVQEIIEKKWDGFGFPIFIVQGIVTLLIAILISFIILFNFKHITHKDSSLLCLFLLVWIFLSIRGIFYDLNHILTHKLEFWGWSSKIRGAALLNNWCTTLEYIFFTIALCCKFIPLLLPSSSSGPSMTTVVNVFIALSGLTIWIHMFYILMGLETTGNFVAIVSAILYHDIPQFAQLYVILLLAFGSAYSMLILSNQEDLTVSTSFEIHFSVLWNLFVYTVNGQSNKVFKRDFIDHHSLYLYEIIVAAYNLSCVLLLLNLLIAMMSTTYSNYDKTAQLILLREKYNIMINFERRLSVKERFRMIYAALFQFNTGNGKGGEKRDCDENDEILVEMHKINVKWLSTDPDSPESLKKLNEQEQLTKHQEHLLNSSTFIDDDIERYLQIESNPSQENNPLPPSSPSHSPALPPPVEANSNTNPLGIEATTIDQQQIPSTNISSPDQTPPDDSSTPSLDSQRRLPPIQPTPADDSQRKRRIIKRFTNKSQNQ